MKCEEYLEWSRIELVISCKHRESIQILMGNKSNKK